MQYVCAVHSREQPAQMVSPFKEHVAPLDSDTQQRVKSGSSTGLAMVS